METPPNQGAPHAGIACSGDADRIVVEGNTVHDGAQTSARGDVTTFTEAERAGMHPRPQLGFTVLYRKGTQEPRPAIVMKVHSDTCVDLVVFASGYPTVVGLISVQKIDGKAGVGVGWFWPDWL